MYQRSMLRGQCSKILAEITDHLFKHHINGEVFFSILRTTLCLLAVQTESFCCLVWVLRYRFEMFSRQL